MNRHIINLLLLFFVFSTTLCTQLQGKVYPIGNWGEDAEGLPCFHYTGALPAVSKMPDGRAAKLSEDPWFLLGNYQLTLFTHVSGEYELITGQRAWGRMNQGAKPNSGTNSSTIELLNEDGSLNNIVRLTGMDSEATSPESCQRTFGCGFARYIYNMQGLTVERTLSVAPSMTIDGGVPAFLLTVRIKNKGGKAMQLRYKESVLANYATTQFQRNAYKPITFKNTYSVVEDSKVVKADFSGTADDPLLIPAREELSMYDAYPPSLFLKLLSDGTVDFDTSGNLSASSTLKLKKGEERTLRMVIGFTFDANIAAIDAMAETLTSPSSLAALWKQVLPELNDEPDKELRRELRWHAYNLEAMATYSTYFKETKIPQGTVYDYYWGQHASARDNFQHALPLIYYNPTLAKSVMRYMAKRTTALGEITLIEYGNGFSDRMYYLTSDQQLFFFLLLSEYLRVTKDYAFLDEPITFYPQNFGKQATMLHCVEKCFIYLRDQVGLGPHGLVKLLNSDWNDNIFVAKKAPYNVVIHSGESLMNTTMAISIFENLIPSIESYAKATDASVQASHAADIARSMTRYQKQVSDAFLRDLGDRTFSRRMYFEGKAIGDNNLFLEPQAYMLQMKELPVSRKKALYEEMKTRVYDGELLGARQQQTPEWEAPGLENGSRENGGFWYALNGPVITGVAQFDKIEAWKLFRRMTFGNYARQLPQYWTSYWSAADNIESSLMGVQAGLPDQSLDYAAIPVYCAHPHAWLLYCYYKLKE